MKEFFIGFAGPPHLAELARHIDRFVALHGETVVRAAPLYVAASAPRAFHKQSMMSAVMAFIDKATSGAEPPMALCRPAAVLDLEDGERCIGVEIDGFSFQKVVPYLLQDFYTTFGYTPLPYEARQPFVPLLSSKDVTDAAFQAACDGLLDWNTPDPNPVFFDALGLFERKNPREPFAESWQSKYQVRKLVEQAA